MGGSCVLLYRDHSILHSLHPIDDEQKKAFEHTLISSSHNVYHNASQQLCDSSHQGKIYSFQFFKSEFQIDK